MSPERFVVFATPTFTQHTAYEFTGAMERVCFLLGRYGIPNTHLFYPGHQFIDAARNVLAKMMLENHQDATDLFFIDDDVGSFPAEKALEFIMREEEIVAAAPPMKTEDVNNPEYAVALQATTDSKLIEQNGLLLARQVPTAFIRIKRPVIERLAAKSDTYIVQESAGAQRVVFNIFDAGPKNGSFVGEDAYFCWRCANEEIDIWLDPDVNLSHRGTYKWEGTFRDQIKKFLEGNHPTAQLRELRDMRGMLHEPTA